MLIRAISATSRPASVQSAHSADRKATSLAPAVARRRTWVALANQRPANRGEVPILGNAGGITRRNPFTADTETVAKDWDDIISLNLNGVFNTTQAFLAPLRAS